MDDAAAVARARAGDSEAFRLVVERHSRGLFRLAYRMTGNAQDAEDVVQEAFLKAYRSLDRFEERAQMGSWLHRIAANCAYDVLRARQRREKPLESQGDDLAPAEPTSVDPGPDRLALAGEVRRRVTAALSHMSDRERAAFVLRHFEGFTLDEIGRALALDLNATKQSLFRAVRKARRLLAPVAGDAS